MSQYETISRCLNPALADLMAARLRAAGFPVLVHSENSALAEGAPMVVGGIRIQVPAERADEAREFLQADEGDSSGPAQAGT